MYRYHISEIFDFFTVRISNKLLFPANLSRIVLIWSLRDEKKNIVDHIYDIQICVDFYKTFHIVYSVYSDFFILIFAILNRSAVSDGFGTNILYIIQSENIQYICNNSIHSNAIIITLQLQYSYVN